MKKGWMIGSCIVIMIGLIMVWNQSFEQKIEETTQEQEKVFDENGKIVDEQGNVIIEGIDERESTLTKESHRSIDPELSSVSGENRENNRSQSTIHKDDNLNMSTARQGQTSMTSNSELTSQHERSQQSPRSEQTQNSNEHVPTSGKSLSKIKQEYVQLFQQLEFRTNGEINRLLGEAETDVYYNGFNNIDKSYYRNRVKDIEERTESEFNLKYEQLHNELQANGYSTQEAIEFRETYEQRKDSRRQELEALMAEVQ